MIGFTDIEQAAGRLEGHISQTPFVHSQTLSRYCGAEIFLKFENLQFTASFKQRGALNKLLSLDDGQRAAGVIAVSAGNHAQGVAYHAGELGIPATIVMPQTTPAIKAARTREFGAEVILAGRNFSEAVAAMDRLRQERGQTLIHPYDDDLVIAGQGTVGLEMFEAEPDLDDVVIAVGGGGLISGIAIAADHLSPKTSVIGVQSQLYPAMAKFAGKWIGEIAGGSTVAEGIAVAEPGQITRSYVERFVDDFIVVPEAKIEEAVALLLQVEKTLCEGAGSAGLAAVLSHPERFVGRKVGLCLCGGNIDNRLLISMLQRQQAREGKLLRLRLVLPDTRGALGPICTLIGEGGGNINSIQHDRGFLGGEAGSARVDIEIELLEAIQAGAIIAELRKRALQVERLEDALAS